MHRKAKNGIFLNGYTDSEYSFIAGMIPSNTECAAFIRKKWHSVCFSRNEEENVTC
jgi:hypothetical protein